LGGASACKIRNYVDGAEEIHGVLALISDDRPMPSETVFLLLFVRA
jgi:hypothetical protein